MNKKFIMLCGSPGSGKSFWAKQYLRQNPYKENIAIISRDHIRFLLVKENEPYFSREEQVFDSFIRQIQTALDENDIDCVVADATHLSRTSRKKVLDRLHLQGVITEAVYFCVPLDLCLKRNSYRKGRERVPEDVIISMHKRCSEPKSTEGFDKIITIKESEIYE